MIQDIDSNVKSKMEKTILLLKENLAKVRTGRAHTGILDQVYVDYYGSDTSISNIASISLLDARNIIVKPYESSLIAKIDKAIRESNLGLNPSINGDIIRVPMPVLTEERRKDLIKIVRNEAEESKVAIRNIRRDFNNSLKQQLKDKEISEDENRRQENVIQKITDSYISEVDNILSRKEKDLIEI